MPFFGMLNRVAFVRTDVSDELSASTIRVTRIGEQGTLAVTSSVRRRSYSLMERCQRFLATRHSRLQDSEIVSAAEGEVRTFR
jgi:hypothetical protein